MSPFDILVWLTYDPATESSGAPPRVLPRIAATLLFFIALEGTIFHTGLYPSIVDPDSTTGSVEVRVRTELRRAKPNRNQLLSVGNSRMGFRPPMANKVASGTGYTFANVAAPGTDARCWYYLLRAVDPTARNYAAILVPSDDYDELDRHERLDERPWDLHYMLVRLQLRDLFEFSWSYPEYWQKWVAFRGILVKGFTYHADFQQLLLHPQKRFAAVRDANSHWGEWADGYTGPEQSLDGLHIDWMRKTVSYPDRIDADQRKLIESVLLEELPPDQGVTTSYFRSWYGRILDHYHGSATKLIFMRLPRAPIPAPEHAPKLNSAVRQLASQPNVIVLPEHLFDSLERPELFMDPIHLNREGMLRFSQMLAAEVLRVLGPPSY